MRILVAEEALQCGRGHWPSYIGDLAGEFRHAGEDVDVLVHRDAAETVVSRVGGTRWFSRNCWVDARSQGKGGGLLHNWFFYKDLKRWLMTKPRYDWVLALTMRLQHLLAFAALSRAGWMPKETRLLLLFVQGFGTYRGPGEPTSFGNSPSNRIARFAFRVMAPAVRGGRVVLSAETKGMRDELERFTGLPVSLFPHPVHKAADGGASVESPVDPDIDSTARLTVTCPGFARHEKGSDLLQDAILGVMKGPLAERFHFVLQWPESFQMPDGTSLGPSPGLLENPHVELINGNLDPAAYDALLARTDFAILPYRRESYHHRLSRVAIEAAGRGIPLIHTTHTWTDEVAQLAGAGVGIHEETPEALVLALMEAAERHPGLKAAAAGGAQRVAKFHSAAQFRQLLVNFSS